MLRATNVDKHDSYNNMVYIHSRSTQTNSFNNYSSKTTNCSNLIILVLGNHKNKGLPVENNQKTIISICPNGKQKKLKTIDTFTISIYKLRTHSIHLVALQTAKCLDLIAVACHYQPNV